MVKFTETIDVSLEWTAAVLFRPFNPRKWLILGFIALMAGQLVGGGCNSSGGGSPGRKAKEAQAAEIFQSRVSNTTTQVRKENIPPYIRHLYYGLSHKLRNPKFLITFTVSISLIVVAVILVFSWLSSRFRFIFLESVVKNDASLKLPFRQHKRIGNSLFLFSIFLHVSFLGLAGVPLFICLSKLAKLGVFNNTVQAGLMQIFFICLPYALWLVFLALILLIFSVLVNDFVLIVMFKDKIRITQALREFLVIVRRHKAVFAKYIFIKCGLTVCAWLISGVLSLLTFVGLILPAGILGAVFYFIYRLLPSMFRTPYFIILFVVLAPILALLFYCRLCLYLPFAVFFRTLSLKVIARIEPRYNLFNYSA